MERAVPCLDDNTIVAFFERRLDDRRSREVDAHLTVCPVCRTLLAAVADDGPECPPSEAVELPSVNDRLEPSPELAVRVGLAQAASRVGTVLGGRWTIEGIIGLGGMAEVFAARHRNGHPVAIKVMRPEAVRKSSLVARFHQEAYLANQVGHPGAVQVSDDGMTDDGCPFLVMELLKGRTLQQQIDEQGPFRFEETMRVGGELLAVLAAAHDKKIVHRDIKPSNLLLTPAGQLRVLDFGLAKLRDSYASSPLTRIGGALGTPGYMPPEQALGQTALIDSRSDVWGAAATMFAMLSGHPVHQANTASDLLMLAATTPAPPIRMVLPEVPREVGEVLDRALSFDREARYLDAGAFRIELARAVGMASPISRDAGTVSVTPAGAGGNRRAWIASVLVTSVVAVAALATILRTHRQVALAPDSASLAPPRAESISSQSLPIVATVAVSADSSARSDPPVASAVQVLPARSTNRPHRQRSPAVGSASATAAPTAFPTGSDLLDIRR